MPQQACSRPAKIHAKAIILQDNRGLALESDGTLLRKRPNPIFSSQTTREGFSESTQSQSSCSPNEPLLAHESPEADTYVARGNDSRILQNLDQTKSSQTEYCAQTTFLEKSKTVSDNNDEEVTRTPIGYLHQATIPPFDEGTEQEQKRSRVVKYVWNPESADSDKILQDLKKISEAIAETRPIEEKAIKLLRKFDMDVEKVVEEIKRNEAYYRNYFSINRRTLRKKTF